MWVFFILEPTRLLEACKPGLRARMDSRTGGTIKKKSLYEKVALLTTWSAPWFDLKYVIWIYGLKPSTNSQTSLGHWVLFLLGELKPFKDRKGAWQGGWTVRTKRTNSWGQKGWIAEDKEDGHDKEDRQKKRWIKWKGQTWQKRRIEQRRRTALLLQTPNFGLGCIFFSSLQQGCFFSPWTHVCHCTRISTCLKKDSSNENKQNVVF